MSEDEKKLGELLAPLVREGRMPAPADHPTTEELAAYHANELTSEEDERIQEHLMVCRECSNLVLGLQALLDAAEHEPSKVSDIKQLEARNALRKKLFAQPVAVQAPVRAEPERRRSALWPAWGLAALLAIAVSGALVYRALSPDTPPAEIQITTLDPVGSLRSGSGEPGIAIETVPKSHEIVLRVDGPSYSEYVAEIRQGERKIKTLTGLREDEPSNVPLGECGSSLETGEYEIVLFGLEKGHRKEAGTYQVRFKDS